MAVVPPKVKAAIAAGLLVVSCGLSFGAAWSYQGARWEADVATIKEGHQRVLAAQAAKALEDYKRMENSKNEAIKEQAAQLATATRSAAAAGDIVKRLRKQLDTVPDRIATATESALREYAATTSGLLGSCTAEYQRMAGIAQRHAIDVRTLLQAWPKGVD